MSDDASPRSSWTVLEILRWTTDYFKKQGIESARVDAEVLLSEILELERIELYAHFDRPMSPDERSAYRALVKRRARREPSAYIVGRREFWSLDIRVDDRVLIPRPDTETLVRTALDYIDAEDTGRLVDIGTGSGAIALALATERPELQIAATDNDADALEVAADNVDAHELGDTVELLASDLFDGIPDDWLPLDYVVSNPPYIAESERPELQPEILDYEPADALFAGDDGLDVIRRLVVDAYQALRPGGVLLFEIGHQQGEATKKLLDDAGFEDVDIVLDYGDRDRVAVGKKPGDESSD